MVFEKILCVESILSQFFIQFEFACVFFTNQIFLSFIFHSPSGDPKHDLVRNLSMVSLGRQTSLPSASSEGSFRPPGNMEQPATQSKKANALSTHFWIKIRKDCTRNRG